MKRCNAFFDTMLIATVYDLRWMPKIPFRYYMLGFRDFVHARDFGSLGCADAASCFLGLVQEKLEKQRRFILPIMTELLPTIEHVARNQDLFEADHKIYGNFPEKLDEIRSLLGENQLL